MFLIITEGMHLIISFLAAFFLFRRYKDWRLIVVCLVFGFLIDIDHLFDYFAFFGFNLRLWEVFNVTSYIPLSGKIIVPLHGWEYLPLLYITGSYLSKRFKIKGLLWAIILPYTLHLLLDHFSYPHHPLAYSLLFRWLNQFDLNVFNAR